MKQHGYSLLIVDDDPDVLANARHILKDYKLECESSPLKALERFTEHEFALVLSDYQMPEMNGVEFLKKCFEIRPKTRRILVSAFVDLIDSEQMWNQARVHRVLSKPYQPDDLVEVVESGILEYVIEEENERLRTLALTDSVTGAANQRYFWDRLRAEFSRAQRFKRPLSLILFDVDHFKTVNDDHGHLQGDQVLKQIATILTKEIRQMDLVARYGGDEFALIMPEISSETALMIAKRLREKIFSLTKVSLSGGVASFPTSTTEKELVANADAALMRVKKGEKGHVLE